MAIQTPVGAGDAGDDAVRFEELWASREALRGVCRSMVGDDALADDMVQEAYLEAFRNLGSLERRDSFLPWLATVARRRGLNELRRLRYSVPVDTFPEPSSAPEWDPAELAASRDEVDRLKAALTALTPRERTLLARQVVTGLSIDELAAEERTTPASVRSVLARARTKLRTAVDDRGIWGLGPVFGAARWLRRRSDEVSLRMQHAGTSFVHGYEGFVHAAAAVAVVAASVGAPAMSPDDPADADAAVSAASPLAYGWDAPRYGPAPDAAWEARPARTSGAPESRESTDQAGSPGPTEPAPDSSDPVDDFFEDADWAHNPVPQPGTPDPKDPVAPVEEEEPAQPQAADIVALAVPEGESVTVFALGQRRPPCSEGCSKLFRSDDGGATWVAPGAQGLGDAHDIEVSPTFASDGRVFAVSELGLLESTDRGETFEPVASLPGTRAAAVSPDFPTDPRVVIAANGPAVYDAGDHRLRPWRGPPPLGTTPTFAFVPSDASLVFAGAVAPGPEGTKVASVYRCVDEVCDDRAILSTLDRTPTVFVPSTHDRDGRVFAYNGRTLLVSHDFGASFERLAVPAPGTVHGMVDDRQGTVYLALAGQDEHSTPVGGVVALRFVDGAPVWDNLTQETPLASGAGALAVVGAGTLLAAPAGMGTGLWCSVDGGATWSTRCGGR